MKVLGIIGGLGPESTIDYYGRVVALYRERKPDGSYPQFMINSINLKKGLDLMDANNLTGMADFLVEEIGKLARAGATFGLISANTPHIVFDELRARANLPLISIVESARDRVRTLGLKTVEDLLAADAAEVSRRLAHPAVTPEAVRIWQHHTSLMCFVPGV